MAEEAGTVTFSNERFTGELLAPEISEMLANRQNHQARSTLVDLMDPEIADVLTLLPPEHRGVAFRLLPRERAADVFTFLPSEEQDRLLDELSNEHLAQIFDEMDPDDRAELFDEMPGQLAAKLLALMRPEERRQTQVILGYPAESVGRLMTPDYLIVRPGWTVQETLDQIRRNGRDAETLDTLYTVDEKGKLLDDIRLRQLLLVDPQRTIESLMDQHVVSLRVDADREEAVRAMERYDRPVLPVVDSMGVMVGIVTFDDVADVAEEEATEDMQKLGGMEALEDPYLAASLLTLVRKRGVWLTILFCGQILTIAAISQYQTQLDRVMALAFFMPLIIASGGNTGSQAATLIIRATALGEVHLSDWWRVVRRELASGLLMGLWLGLMGMAIVTIFDQMQWIDFGGYFIQLTFTIFSSLLCVVTFGSLLGSTLPLGLRLLGLDPATGSSPMVATLMDVTGLMIYFTIAIFFLHI